jgi:hypothetical protein
MAKEKVKMEEAIIHIKMEKEL